MRLTLLLAAGCTGHSAPLEWRLDDGRPAFESGADAATTVTLVMDPAECFTCSAVLMEWLEWRRANPDRFRLLFTRRPTEPERRRLQAVRLPLAGHLANGPRGHTPMEIVVRDGRIVFADSSVTNARGSRLLSMLWTSSLDAALHRLAPSPTPP